jgi:hypothetical protein
MTCRLSFALVAVSSALALSCSNMSIRADCPNVDVGACGVTPGCVALEGVAVNTVGIPARTCAASARQILGCGEQTKCEAKTPTRAKDRNGREWILDSACLPPGWKATSATPTLATCPTCASLSPAECASSSYCSCGSPDAGADAAGDATTDSNGDAPAGETSPVDCTKVALSACAKTPGCLALGGSRVDTVRNCGYPSEVAACQNTPPGGGLACPAVVSFATDPHGQRWLFGGCVPAGFTNVTTGVPPNSECPTTDGGADGGDAAKPNCAAVAPSACAATAGCEVVTARRVDAQQTCYGPMEPAACKVIPTEPVGCGDTITLATDPQGQRWYFPSTCIPAGFTNISPSNPPHMLCADGGATDATAGQ